MNCKLEDVGGMETIALSTGALAVADDIAGLLERRFGGPRPTRSDAIKLALSQMRSRLDYNDDTRSALQAVHLAKVSTCNGR